MTPEYVSEILQCRRDKDGHVVPETAEEDEPLSLRAAFREKWEREGLRPDQIDVLWRRYLGANPRAAEWVRRQGGETT